MRTSLIVATDLDGCIGAGNAIPWYVPDDLVRFRDVTRGHVCVAGSKTHHSIVARLKKPLPGRITVVVTGGGMKSEGPVIVSASPIQALDIARAIEANASRDEVFVIGGARIYEALLPVVDRVYFTRMHLHVHGDAYMPPGWLDPFTLTKAVGEGREGHRYEFEIYDREV